MRRFGSLMLVVLAASAASAGKFYYQQNESGDWNDASKWHKDAYNGETGTLPGIGDEVFLFGSDGAECTIAVHGNVSIATLNVQNWASGEVTYTLTGDGKLTLGSGLSAASGTALQINSNTTLVMDGPDVYSETGMNYCEGGTLIVKKGTLTPYNLMVKTFPGKLIIDGGTVTGEGAAARSITIRDGWKDEAEAPCGTVELRSGRLDAKCSLISGWFKMSGGTWDRSGVASTQLFSALFDNPILHFSIEGGSLITHKNDKLPDDPIFLERLDSLHYTTIDNGAQWTPSRTNGVYGIREISAPHVNIMLTNEVSLACELLECRSLLFKGDDVHYVDYNVLTTRFCNLPAYKNGQISSTSYSSAPFFIESHDFLRFEADTANSGIVLHQGFVDNALWRFHKGFSVKTTAGDGVSPADFSFCNPYFGNGSRVEVDGCGTATIIFSRDSQIKNIYSNTLECVSVGGGCLGLSQWSWNQRTSPFRTDRLELGPGAKIDTVAAAYAHVDANEVVWDSSNELMFSTPDLTNTTFPTAPIMVGPKHVNDFQTDEERPKVTFTTEGFADNWNFKWINGQPVIWRKGVSERTTKGMPPRTTVSKWRGTKDGNWDDAANWLIDDGKVLATDPLDQSMIFDGGYMNTRISVNSAVQACQIRVYDQTAPVAFVGDGTIELKGNTYARAWWFDTGYVGAITSGSDHPVVFDVPVSASTAYGLDYRNLAVIHGGRGYVAFMKQVEGGHVFAVQGDVRVAGNVTAQNLLLHRQMGDLPSKRTRLSVLPGGTVTATQQTLLQEDTDCDICIYSDAMIRIENDVSAECMWGYTAGRTPISVKKSGKFDCRAPLGGTCQIGFSGEGEVRLADTGSRATAAFPVVFDGVTFAVDSFAEGHPISLKGSTTWASKSDWTYSASLGEVVVSSGETLTVDTGDLDDESITHSVRIDAPLVAERIVKVGDGTLTLGSANNDIGSLVVDAGTLDVGAAQSFGSLEFAEGTMLRLGSSKATVTVADGVLDFSRFTISIDPTAMSNMKSWTTVLRVPSGAASGMPTFAANVKVRAIKDGADAVYQVKASAGFAVVIR